MKSTPFSSHHSINFVGAAELGGEQVPAGEDVQWQIAIAVVERIEVPPFLLAVDRIVRGIEIDDQPARRLVVGLCHHRHKQTFHRGGVVRDLVIWVRPDLRRMLQPIEGRLASERRAIRALGGQSAAEHAEHRIVAQLIVIDDVLVAERDTKNALAQHRRQLVNGERRVAAVLEASGEARHEADRLVGLAEQQRAGVGGDRAAVESAHNLTAFDGSEIERILTTLCRHRGSPSSRVKSLLHNNFR